VRQNARFDVTASNRDAVPRAGKFRPDGSDHGRPDALQHTAVALVRAWCVRELQASPKHHKSNAIYLTRRFAAARDFRAESQRVAQLVVLGLRSTDALQAPPFPTQMIQVTVRRRDHHDGSL
jgi:hypothetical protein